jgi:uncharacterized protein YndB with AHSA1/START domain
MTTMADRIEKQVVLQAPRARVWKALTDSREFGQWFGVEFDGPFVAGQPLRGTIVPTKADPDVARAQQPYVGTPFHILVERMEPERLFSFRWHPFAIDPGADSAAEPTTLVVFTLEEAPGGVRVTVTESGFDRVPLERRAKAFSANESGWAIQMTLVEKYLAQKP